MTNHMLDWLHKLQERQDFAVRVLIGVGIRYTDFFFQLLELSNNSCNMACWCFPKERFLLGDTSLFR